MQPTVDTTGWLRQRNLEADFTSGNELPREVEVYLLVTFTRHPHSLPLETRAYLAARFFGHVGGCRMD